jgi:hypothetical protein
MNSMKLVNLLVFVVCMTIYQHASASSQKFISGTLVVQFPAGSSELPKSYAAGNYVQNSCLVDLKSTFIVRVDILAFGDNSSAHDETTAQLQLATERADALRDRMLKLGIGDAFIWTTARTTNSTPLVDGENAFVFYTGESCYACSRSGKCDTSDIYSTKSVLATTSSSPNVKIKLNIRFPFGSDIVPESFAAKNATYAACLKSISPVKAIISSANDIGLEGWGSKEQTEIATKRINSLRTLIADHGLPDMTIGAAIFVRPRPTVPVGYVPEPEKENAWIEYSGTCKDELECFKCKVLSE